MIYYLDSKKLQIKTENLNNSGFSCTVAWKSRESKQRGFAGIKFLTFFQ